MKYTKYPWPTDGATRTYVDRLEDKLVRKMDRIQRSISRSVLRLVEMEAQVAELIKRIEE